MGQGFNKTSVCLGTGSGGRRWACCGLRFSNPNVLLSSGTPLNARETPGLIKVLDQLGFVYALISSPAMLTWNFVFVLSVLCLSWIAEVRLKCPWWENGLAIWSMCLKSHNLLCWLDIKPSRDTLTATAIPAVSSSAPALLSNNPGGSCIDHISIPSCAARWISVDLKCPIE